MKTFKKITALTAALFIMITAVFSVNSFAYESGGISYVASGSGYAVESIKAIAGENVIIPSQVDNKDVIAIKAGAARGNAVIQSVMIPSFVKTVGEYAFAECSNLKFVAFEQTETVVSIKSSAFLSCISLKVIALPTMTVIQPECFKGCTSLETPAIPATVTSIGNEAFMQCSSMTGFSIPASVTSIGDSAFYNCKGITEFTVDSSSTSFKAVDGALYTYDGKKLVQYPLGKAGTSYSVTQGTETIGNGAFAFSSLATVTLNNEVKDIENYAFSDCSALSSINFPQGLESIGTNAFLRCYALKTAVLPASLTSFDSAFVDCGLESVTFESGLKTISPNAFKDCKSLKSVSIPGTVTEIKYGAFYGCTALEKVYIPASVTKIGEKAFYGCGNLVLEVDSGSYAETYAQNNSIEYSIKGSQQGEDNASVAILGYKSNLSVGYKTTVTFHAQITSSEGGYRLYWVINDTDVHEDAGNASYTVSSAVKTYSVKCIAVSGDKTLESPTETVTVSSNFIAKIVYFFRNIFAPGKLVIDQK